MTDNALQGNVVPDGTGTTQEKPAEFSTPLVLPSLGVYYDNKVPSGKGTIIPIRGEQEELLAGAGDGVEASPVLRLVVDQLSDFNKYPSENLLVSDWIYTLLNILAFSYDPVLTFSPVCPEHGIRVPTSINIEEMECVRVDPKRLDDWKEPFETDPLPWSKDKITWRLLRIHDMEKIENYVSQVQDASMAQRKPGHIYTLARHIEAINGKKLKTIDKLTWVRSAFGKDLRALQDAFNAKETGYNLRPKFKCPKGHWFRARLPLDGRFFRSQGDSDLGDVA